MDGNEDQTVVALPTNVRAIHERSFDKMIGDGVLFLEMAFFCIKVKIHSFQACLMFGSSWICYGWKELLDVILKRLLESNCIAVTILVFA